MQGKLKKKYARSIHDSLALVVGKVVLLETGTAVALLITRNTDLFLAVAVSSARKISSGRDRRVLTFPSGCLLGRKLDAKFFVGGSQLLAASLSVAVPVGRREDAERDGNTSFKVQIDDLCGRERIFSYNLSWARKEDKKNPLAG